MRRVTFSTFGPGTARVMLTAFALLLGTGVTLAQSGDARAQDQSKQGAAAATDPARDNQRDFLEAEQAINGPAANRECVWLGRRVVSLMWRDDLDTAFRHLDLYDRFGCPGGHVQAAFRCLTRFPALDPKAPPEALSGRVHACWVNPALQPQQPATTATAPAPTPGAAAPPPAAAPATK